MELRLPASPEKSSPSKCPLLQGEQSGDSPPHAQPPSEEGSHSGPGAGEGQGRRGHRK